MEAAQVQSSPTLLMLDEPRVIAIRDGKHNYSFHFRRITQPDWERYFAGLYVASRAEGAAQVNTVDANSAGIELFESTLAKVEGYSRELSSREDFVKVKPGHAIVVSWALRAVSTSTIEDAKPLDPDCVEARIDAIWSQLTPGDDTIAFKGLIHRFSPPTAEQKKRVMRGAAISRVVGGSRKGTTIYSSRNKIMLELYDQLIQSVDGYGIAGRPLGSVEEIRREMDGYHKAEAVSQLFNSVDPAPAAAEVEAA